MRSPRTPLDGGWPLVVGGLLAPALAFALLAGAVVVTPRLEWDQDLLGVVPDAAARDALLAPATYAALLVMATVPVFLLVARRGRDALFWSLGIGGVLVLDPVLKHAFRRPPIDGEHGVYSFPSGSAMLAMAAASAAVLLARSSRRRVALLLIGSLAVFAYGLALVAARWHYPSDVVGGWAFALAWVSGVRLALLARV